MPACLRSCVPACVPVCAPACLSCLRVCRACVSVMHGECGEIVHGAWCGAWAVVGGVFACVRGEVCGVSGASGVWHAVWCGGWCVV
eukprot:800829-Alexandrium_andersonii.AAC.1